MRRDAGKIQPGRIPSGKGPDGAGHGPRPAVLIALFAAAVVLFNFPLLSVWTAPVTVFGLPLLPVALFVIWAGLIALLATVTEGGGRGP